MIQWADFPSGTNGLYGTDTSKMLDGVWAAFDAYSSSFITIVEDPASDVTGKVLQVDNGTSIKAGIRWAMSNGAVTTAGVQFKLWMSDLPYGSWGFNHVPLWQFRTDANEDIVSLSVSPTGAILTSSTELSSGQTGTTGAPVLVAGAWNMIETKIVRHASAGTLQVKVNNTLVLSLTSQAFGSNDVGIVFLGAGKKNTDTVYIPEIYFKDIVIWDGTGSQNNDFLGHVFVGGLLPTGDSSFNWTPSTGSTGYNLVDDTSGADDADYISADNTPPAASSFTLSDLPADVTSVKAVIPVARMKKSDSGDCTVQMSITDAGTDTDGDDRQITTAYTYWWDVMEINTRTSSPFTPAEVNGATIKINRTT